MLPAPLLLLGSGPSFCTVLAMCAHLFRRPYTLCSNLQYFNVIQLNEDNAICGLHWHSRYSIVDFYIVLLHFRMAYRDLLWPTSTKCDQDPSILCNINRNSLYTSRSSHYSVILCDLVILIISHVSHVQMTQVYHFTIVASVEASSPLKMLSFFQHEL